MAMSPTQMLRVKKFYPFWLRAFDFGFLPFNYLDSLSLFPYVFPPISHYIIHKGNRPARWLVAHQRLQ